MLGTKDLKLPIHNKPHQYPYIKIIQYRTCIHVYRTCVSQMQKINFKFQNLIDETWSQTFTYLHPLRLLYRKPNTICNAFLSLKCVKSTVYWWNSQVLQKWMKFEIFFSGNSTILDWLTRAYNLQIFYIHTLITTISRHSHGVKPRTFINFIYSKMQAFPLYIRYHVYLGHLFQALIVNNYVTVGNFPEFKKHVLVQLL